MLTYGDILVKLMELSNYRKVNRDPQNYYFFVSAKETKVVFIADKKVTGDDVLYHARMLEQIDGDKHIICIKGYTHDAEKIAEKLDISLNSREEFARDIGEYVLRAMDESQEDKLLEELFREEDFEIENIETEAPEDTIPIFLEEIPSQKEQIIKPQISKEQAAIKVQKKIHGFDAALVLVPYLTFEYIVDILVEGELTPKRKNGVICVNLSSEQDYPSFEFFDSGLESIATILEKHERIAIEISKEEAELIAKDAIITKYTGEQESSTVGENVVIIEKKRYRPKNDSIKLNNIGIYYWPFWIVRGARGYTKLDAVKGEILSENIEHRSSFF